MSEEEIIEDKIDESTMLKQIKNKLVEKNIPIETFIAEWERLENLEDDLTTVYMNGFYDAEQKWKDKIKEVIYPTPTNAIPIEIQESELYKKILDLLEEDNK